MYRALVRRKMSVLVLLILKHINSRLSDENCTSCAIPKSTKNVSTKDPSAKLIIIVTYIVKVYAPIWFVIKSKPSCKDGARHLFQTIYKPRYLSKEIRAVIDQVI